MPTDENGFEIADEPQTDENGFEVVQEPRLDTSEIKLPPQAPPFMSQFGPATPEERVTDPLAMIKVPLQIAGAAAGGVTDTASEVAADFLRRTGINPAAQAGAPQINIPSIPITDIGPGIPGPLKLLAPRFAKGAEEEAGRFLSGFSEPGQSFLLPFAGLKPVQAVFGAQAAAQIPESIQEIAQSKNPEELGAAIASGAANLAIAHGIGRSLMKGPNAEVKTSISSGTGGRGGQLNDLQSLAGKLSETIRQGDPIGLQHQLAGVALDKDQLRRLIARLPAKEQTALQAIGQMVSRGRSFSEAAKEALTVLNRQEGTSPVVSEIPSNKTETIPTEKVGGTEGSSVPAGILEKRTEITQPRKLDYASQNRTAEALYGSLRSFTGEGEGQMPSEVRGGGVQPQAPQAPKAEQARILLDPQDQAYLDAERAGIDAPVEVTQDLPSGQPFAGKISTIDRGSGKIYVNPTEFTNWLRGIPEARRPQAVRSLLDEERIHLGVDDDSALSYWKALTGFEKAINRRRYIGPYGTSVALDDTQLGHEALRFRLQQLARMTPREIAEATGRERWTVQGITALESAVRQLREVFDRKATGTQKAILDRMQESLATAKVATGVAPGALYKQGAGRVTSDEVEKMDTEEANKFFDDLRGKGVAVQYDSVVAGLKLSPDDVPGIEVQREVAQREAMDAAKSGDDQAFKAGMGKVVWYNGLIEGARKQGPNFDRVMEQSQEIPTGKNLKLQAGAKPHQYQDTFNDLIQEGIKRTDADDLIYGRKTIKQVVDDNLNIVTPSRDFSRLAETPDSSFGHFEAMEEGYKNAMARIATILDRSNLPALTEPAALRKAKKPAPQEELFLPPMAKGETERPTATEVGASPVTGHAFELSAYSHLQQATDDLVSQNREKPGSKLKAPKFDEFAKEMRLNFGDIGTGALKEAWERNIWRRLVNASGETLGVLRKALNLRAVLGERDISDPVRGGATPAEQLASEAKSLLGTPMFAAEARERLEMSKEAREAQTAAMRYRSTVMTAIAQEMLEDADKSFRKFNKTSLSPEDIGFERKSNVPAWHPVTNDDLDNVSHLGTILTDSARENTLPVSVTKRVTVMQNRATGKVDMVSTYRDGRRGPVLLDPESPGKTHSPLESILQRYRPVYSVLLDEPVKDFHQRFDSLGDFENKFGADARRAAQISFVEPAGAEGEIVPQRATTGRMAIPGQFVSAPGVLESTTPITDAEAGGILDHILAESGSFDSPDDVKASWISLSEKPNYQVISGYRKLAMQLARDNPNLTGDELLDRLAQNLYENHQAVQTFEDFVGRTVAQGAPQGEENVGTQRGKTQSQINEQRILQMRRQTAAPEPKGLPGMPRAGGEAFQSQEDLHHPGPPGSSAPAALAKRKREVRATVSRREVKQDMGRLLDGFLGDAGGAAEKAREYVILASGEDLPAKQPGVGGFVQGIKAKALARTEAEKRQEAAKVLVALATTDPVGITTFDRNKVFDPKGRLQGLDQLENWADVGIAKGQNLLASKDPLDKLKGRQWVRAAEQLKREVQFVRSNWGDKKLEAAAHAVIEQLRATIQFEQNNGSMTTIRENYFPGRYEGELWNDDELTFGESTMLGRQYGKPKKFRNYYEAIAGDPNPGPGKPGGPYIPKSYNAADVVGHRVAQGHRRIARGQWLEGWKEVTDPHTGKPVAVEPRAIYRKDPAGGPPIFSGWEAPDAEHDLVSLTTGGKPIAFRKGYVRLATALAKPDSALETNPVGKAALSAQAMLKHGWLLMLDTFHPGRLMQYAAAISGHNWYDVKGSFRGGYSALHYAPDQLDAAVRQGYITRQAANYARATVPLNVNGRTLNIPRYAIAQELVKRGLNANKFVDALHKDAVKYVPFVGGLLTKYNDWLFNRFVPGLVTERAVENLERLSASHPNLTFDNIAKSVVTDMNVTFGNLGRQGIFKTPIYRSIAQLLFLAPQWREGLVQKEVRMGSRIIRAPFYYGGKLTGAEWMRRLGGRDTLPYWGPIGREMTRGLLAYFAFTQMANLVTRGKPTWQNEEPDHKMDAWIPTGKDTGFWISPLSTFAEVLHSYLRMSETKERQWDAVKGFFLNALGPAGRAANVLLEGESPSGQYLPTTGRVLGEAARQFAPLPLSLSTPARALAHHLAPNLVGPLRPGEGTQRGLSALGLKTDVAQSPIQMIQELERKYEAQNKPPGMMHMQPTDEPSYAKLRGLVAADDKQGVWSMLKQLRANGYSDEKILKAMDQFAKKNFAWSNEAEDDFQQWLTPGQREIYARAFEDKLTNYQKFLEMYADEP